MDTPPGVATARLLLDTYSAGSVILSPTVPLFRVPEDGGSALYPQGALGALVGPTRYVEIVATDANVAPSPFQWRIQYAIENLQNQPDSILFDAPAGSVQSLADLTPLDLAPSIVKVVSDEDRRDAELARDQARDYAMAAAESAAEAAGGPGGAGGGAFARTGQTWFLTHGLGRLPVYQVWVGGQPLFVGNVTTTEQDITIQFPTPQTGVLVVK